MKTLLELQAIQSIGNSQSTSQSVSSEQSVFTELLQDVMSSSSTSLTDSENLLGYFGSLTDPSTNTASLLGSLGSLPNTSTNSTDYLSAFAYSGGSNNYLPSSTVQNDENNISNYLNKDYLNTAGFTNVLAGANAYSDIIAQAAQKYGVPEKLIASVMKQESNFKENAVSSAGATGLMQLMPGTARYLGVQDSTDPAQNIMGGTKYLGQMLDKFDQNIELALAAYNAGPGNVQKYGGIPPFSETKNYVKKIMNYYNA
ncbi:MAG TPA: lytic transglycosylase domain-containing protein [Ureibacillus sp.]|nr:lytic transglycosylase domain-containing protein [Ureibacillus sp.]